MAAGRELILGVGDGHTIVALVRAYLVSAGFEVITAQDGAEALRLIREREPRLVVLDLMLPEMDGVEVTRAVRRWSRVPILILTARGLVGGRSGGGGGGGRGP